MTFNLTIADWFALFRKIGFAVVDYKELYAPENVTGVQDFVPGEWAKDYPNEQVWWLTKTV